jgi:hypothetical protein
MYLSIYLPNGDCLYFLRLTHFTMIAVMIIDGKNPMVNPKIRFWSQKK